MGGESGYIEIKMTEYEGLKDKVKELLTKLKTGLCSRHRDELDETCIVCFGVSMQTGAMAHFEDSTKIASLTQKLAKAQEALNKIVKDTHIAHPDSTKYHLHCLSRRDCDCYAMIAQEALREMGE